MDDTLAVNHCLNYGQTLRHFGIIADFGVEISADPIQDAQISESPYLAEASLARIWVRLIPSSAVIQLLFSLSTIDSHVQRQSAFGDIRARTVAACSGVRTMRKKRKTALGHT
jgi:hypothetical protein